MLPTTAGLALDRNNNEGGHVGSWPDSSDKVSTAPPGPVHTQFPASRASNPDPDAIDLPVLEHPSEHLRRQLQHLRKPNIKGEGVAESGGRGSPSDCAPSSGAHEVQDPIRGQELEPATSSHTAGKRQFEEVDDAEDESKHGTQKAPKKPRLVWTPELHARFMNAVNHLGVKNAVPKTILQLMNVEGMTRENVASHLQKYRLYLKRLSGYPPNARVPAETLQQAQEQAMHHQAQQAALQHNFNLVQGMGAAVPFGLQPVSYGVQLGVPQGTAAAPQSSIGSFPTFAPPAPPAPPHVSNLQSTSQPEPITTAQLFYPSWVPAVPSAGQHSGFMSYPGGGLPVAGAQGLPQVMQPGYAQQMQGWDWSKPLDSGSAGHAPNFTLPSIPQLDVGVHATIQQDDLPFCQPNHKQYYNEK